MAKGKYQSQNQINWFAIAILAIVLAIIAGLAVILLKGCDEDQDSPGNDSYQSGQQEDDTTKEPEPSQSDPTESQPEETDPVVTDPTESDPAVTDPTETDPTEADPTETDPTESDPTESEPTESEPVETDPVETDPVKNSGDEVAELAVSLVGQPERSDTYPDGFDVGSFITYCFRSCGVSDVPSSFNSLITYGKEVTQYRPGDVVIFHITPAEGDPYYYIGIVVEGNRFVAVSSSSEKVTDRPISEFSAYPTVYRRYTEA